MLNFKEYTLMSFKNIFQERFKNHFLKKAGKDIFKYQLGSGYLSSLSINGDNSKAIAEFVKLINTKDVYKDLYDKPTHVTLDFSPYLDFSSLINMNDNVKFIKTIVVLVVFAFLFMHATNLVIAFLSRGGKSE